VDSDENGFPHSHPTLTLNTGNLGHDERLLSEFVHEQIHWFEERKPEQCDAAIRDLKKSFPDLPTQRPEGAQDRRSSYLHLVVCYLEFQAMKELVGASRRNKLSRCGPTKRTLIRKLARWKCEGMFASTFETTRSRHAWSRKLTGDSIMAPASAENCSAHSGQDSRVPQVFRSKRKNCQRGGGRVRCRWFRVILSR